MNKLRYYSLIALVTVAIWLVWFAIVDYSNNDSNNDNELQYIESADCDALKIYLDAAEEGMTLFAYWTYQTQETINFRITPENVEIGQKAYDSRTC